MTVREHYERLLAPVYRWSVTDENGAYSRGRAQLAELGLLEGQRYLDLGAGFGAHSIPLARAGKEVTAVDFDAHLLTQLSQAAGHEGLSLESSHGDILDFLEGAAGRRWDVILCLGDTLTHLQSPKDVHRLLQLARARLEPNGRFAVGYRDSTGAAATGIDRFIAVGRDARRSMHCLLEPLDDRHLRVTDMVTELEEDGPRTRMSDYIKLRIAREELATWAGAAGLMVAHETIQRGMSHLLFREDAPAGR